MPQAVHIEMQSEAGAWKDVGDNKITSLPEGDIHVAFIDNGTTGGRPVMMLRVDDDEDKHSWVLQLTVRNLQAISAASEGKYGKV